MDQDGPGTLYGPIKRMLAEGLIEESDERPDPAMDDQRRRYYRITDFGRRVAGAEAERMSGLVETACARRLLGGRGTSLPEDV
jgi:DNA-binding PadR family transcriptional regulator